MYWINNPMRNNNWCNYNYYYNLLLLLTLPSSFENIKAWTADHDTNSGSRHTAH